LALRRGGVADASSRSETTGDEWHTLLAYCLERDTLVRSVKTALVVGTILALINHGKEMIARGSRHDGRS
jgi:hypothetical protein